MSSFFKFEGKKIAFDVHGSGDAILLLHGFMESKKIWSHFVETLSKEFTIITIDLPGHGESEMVNEVHSMKLMSLVIKELLDHAGISKVVLTGHSMGGYIGIEFAKQYPDLIKGMVLFHSQAAPDTEEDRENRRRAINIIQRNRGGYIHQFIPNLFDSRHVKNYQPFIEELIQGAVQMSSEAIIAAQQGMRSRKGGLDYLITTDHPILFIIGKQDTRLQYTQLLAQAVIPAHAEVLLLDNVGHMGYVEAPELTLQTVRHFALKCYGS